MEWKTEKRKISELKFNEKNPRKMSKDDSMQLKRSMEKFGVCEPIVINWDNTIIGGHQRVRTLKGMGHKEVNVCLPDAPLSEKEANELNIRLNRNSGEWDYDILGNSWNPDELVDWGFSMDELHLESIPSGEDGDEKIAQKCSMNITFLSANHLQEAENLISVIVDAYEGATYKVRVK